MINFYIDDSGSISINDTNQPVLLFSSICIPGHAYKDIINDTKNLIDTIYNDIRTKLISICSNGGEFGPTRSVSLADFFLEKTKKDFEIHCSEITRGDGLYLLFSANDREQYLIDVLNLIKKYDFKIMTVYCDKSEFKAIYNTLDDSALENKKNFEIADVLIKTLTEHLKEFNEQGCIIIDEGNNIINNVMVPGLDSGALELESENLSRYIQQVKSHENVLIQLADVVAYITNMKLSIDKKLKLGTSVSPKNQKRSKKFYDLIENNNVLINILSQENETSIESAS